MTRKEGLQGTTNPFSRNQDCYTESRDFLASKPLLRHLAKCLQQLNHEAEDPHDAFVGALDPVWISEETALSVTPLIALPEIAAIACADCEHTLPGTEKGLMKHMRELHSPIQLSGSERRDRGVQIRDIVLRHCGLTSSAACNIPHSIHFFPSLALRLDGVACAMEGCGWVYATVPRGKAWLKEGIRHMNNDHGIKQNGSQMHRNRFIYPLPVQRVERLDSRSPKVYFITCLPPRWQKEFDELNSMNDDGAQSPQRDDESACVKKYHLEKSKENTTMAGADMTQRMEATQVKPEESAAEDKKNKKNHKREGETREERTERKRRKKERRSRRRERKRSKRIVAGKGDPDVNGD